MEPWQSEAMNVHHESSAAIHSGKWVHDDKE